MAFIAGTTYGNANTLSADTRMQDWGKHLDWTAWCSTGALKRVDMEVSEELIMYRTMLDLIKPKLVYLDLPLFMALLSDLFPGVEQPPTPAGALRLAIEADLLENNLQVRRDLLYLLLTRQQSQSVLLLTHQSVSHCKKPPSFYWQLLA